MNLQFVSFGLVAALIAVQSAIAVAEPKTHTVEMITDKGQKIFAPMYLKVAVGDTVRFVNASTNHNTESMRGMIPEGAARWNSKLEKTFDLKVTHEGVYAYRCTPHYR